MNKVLYYILKTNYKVQNNCLPTVNKQVKLGSCRPSELAGEIYMYDHFWNQYSIILYNAKTDNGGPKIILTPKTFFVVVVQQFFLFHTGKLA